MGESRPSDDGMLAADPFAALPTDAPRLSPMATPEERKQLIAELQGLISSGTYEVAPEVVAVAIMREGRWQSL